MGASEISSTDKPVKPLLGIPPPLVTVLILGVGLGIHFGISNVLIFPEGWVQFAVGIPIIVLGLGFGLKANKEFSSVGTDDRFAAPTSVIVTTGSNANASWLIRLQRIYLLRLPLVETLILSSPSAAGWSSTSTI